MKKILSFLITMACVLIFSGCGHAGQETQQYEDQSQMIVTEALTEAVTEALNVTEAETSVSEEDTIQYTGAPPEYAGETEPAETEKIPEQTVPASEEEIPDEHGSYTSREDVALYIHTYGKLPENFISKKDAEKLGWSGGSLEPYAPGKCIGGSRFGNYEGILPDKKGRTYTECDIDTAGSSKRGAKRIVFSNDGLIYYTEDHYETFELLYGDED